MARGNVLKRVRLVKDDKIVCKENSLATFLTLGKAAKQGEKEGVIQHHEIGREDPAVEGLIKAAVISCAALLRADVLLASHLLPHLWIGLHQKVAQRAVPCAETPFPNPLQFGTLARREKVGGLTQGAFKPGAAEEIVSPL